MSRQTWTKRDPIKNYFPLPNEIYSLGLSPGAVVVYGYLMRQEDRKTYQCLASYRTIGEFEQSAPLLPPGTAAPAMAVSATTSCPSRCPSTSFMRDRFRKLSVQWNSGKQMNV